MNLSNTKDGITKVWSTHTLKDGYGLHENTGHGDWISTLLSMKITGVHSDKIIQSVLKYSLSVFIVTTLIMISLALIHIL